MIGVKIIARDSKGRQTVNALIHLPEDSLEIELKKIITDLKPIHVTLANGEEVPLRDCQFFVNDRLFPI
ncbi:MAG: hypothetical protein EAX90_04230 [Candidatus Heimdallarchaeota archaeon]|nr:hypothetical protein [Candidatus Heimdallarchaeota archaeon]